MDHAGLCIRSATSALIAYFLGPGLWALAAIGLYLAITAMASQPNTAKARSTENRLDNLVTTAGNTNARVTGLSGKNTSTNGLPDGTIGGHTDSAGLADGTINGSTGQINTGGGTAHTHGPGTLSVANGNHQHGANATNGNLAVNNGQHSHVLPSV